MRTELVQINNDDVSLSDELGFIGGQEELDITNLKLIQPINSDEEKGLSAGMFYDDSMDAKNKTINFVLFGIRPGRSKMPPATDGFQKGTKPLCFSVNGIEPINTPDYPRLDGGEGCANCEFSQWYDNAKPSCKEYLTLTLMDLSTSFLHYFQVSGKNLSAVKELRKRLVRLEGQARLMKKPFVLHNQVISMKANVVKDKGYRYAVLNFSAPKPIEEPEMIAYLADIKDKLNRKKLAKKTDPVQEALDKSVNGNDEPPFDTELVA